MATHKTKDTQAKLRFKAMLESIHSQTDINPFETEQDKVIRIQQAKIDYAFFVEYYFPNFAKNPCADFHLKTAKIIRKDKFCKLLLAWGRGLAKSTHLNILVPLWLWINDDLKVMVLVGQNQEKANILLSDLQAQLEANQRLINDFGAQKQIGSWEDGRFVTQNDCAFFALGMGQSPRGLRHRQHRPDYIVADDLDTKEVSRNPKRVRQYANWICEDLIPTTDITGGRYIQVNNIFAPHTILTEINDTRQGFKLIRQDATDKDLKPHWHQKYTQAFYADLQKTIGTLSFQSEYNNNPYTEGTIFTADMIHWENIPPLRSFQSIIAYWDVAYSDAKTADYNALKVWGVKDGIFYLIDALVAQCKMKTVIEWMYQFRKQVPESIHINFYYESQFWNDALRMVFDQTVEEQGYRIPLVQHRAPKTNKYDRIISLLPYYQQGKISYNKAQQANPNFQIGIAQLMGIEPGYKSHDDSPDADAEALAILSRRQSKKANQYIIATSISRKY